MCYCVVGLEQYSDVYKQWVAGVVYRDLKPENVLLQANGHVQLTDFDLSLLTNSNAQVWSFLDMQNLIEFSRQQPYFKVTI